ncbi:hypothetical protein C8F01DRAFT_548589 [Mycena amicta]|nr:hypothetical protein C8F01DRAFT_548589 [Mycena amicta]
MTTTASTHRSIEPPSASELRAQLVFLDTEVAQLRVRLAELAQQRKAVSEQLKAVRYPILTVPPEITSQFFEYYAELVAEAFSSFKRGPFVLTHVCRAWRQISLGMPKLWACISVDGESSAARDKLLHRWFERADNALLDVSLSTTESRLFSVVTGHSDRLQSLSCFIPLPAACSLDGIFGRIPHLRRLELRVVNVQPAITVFSDAPVLRQLSVSGAFVEGLDLIQLPWAQLTELYFDANFPNLLSTLDGMKNLRVLRLPSRRSYMAPANPIQLDHLSTLHCAAQGVVVFSIRFLSSLCCPALEVLRVDDRPRNQTKILCDFLDGTPRLREMTLRHLTTEELVKVLGHAPSISSLTLRDVSLRVGLLRIFDPFGATDFLPNLHTFTIEARGIEDTDHAILSMLEARSGRHDNSRAALRRFNLTTQAPMYKPLSPGAFAESLRDLVGPLGCQVNVLTARLSHFDSKSSCLPGQNLLYSLEDVNEGL